MDHDQEKRLLEIVRTSLGDKALAYESEADLASAVIGDLRLDSLEKLQLILDLETALSVMANESEVAACRKVGDLVGLMMRSQGRQKHNA